VGGKEGFEERMHVSCLRPEKFDEATRSLPPNHDDSELYAQFKQAPSRIAQVISVRIPGALVAWVVSQPPLENQINMCSCLSLNKNSMKNES
jgi:hypothetical protein